jgi:hypothetical protein
MDQPLFVAARSRAYTFEFRVKAAEYLGFVAPPNTYIVVSRRNAECPHRACGVSVSVPMG